MATNTLNGLSLTVIAQEAINALTAKLPLITSYTTDFSSEIEQVGGAVVTRIPSTLLTQDGAVSGYNPQAAVSTAKTVTLSGWQVASVGFNDKEASTLTMQKLQSTFIQPLVYAVTKSVTQSLMGCVNATNFPSATYTGAVAASFDADKMADASTTLNAANAPDYQRTAVLAPTFYGALAKDNAIQASYAFGGTEAIRDGVVPRVHGSDIFNYTDLPNGPAAEGLRGFFSSKDALLIASRAPAVPASFPGEVINVTEPNSQFTVQFRSFYDALNGQTVLAATTLYGVAVGNSGSLTRMVTGAV